jgi:glycosyltransferase involved in cell wall biosynthesis
MRTSAARLNSLPDDVGHPPDVLIFDIHSGEGMTFHIVFNRPVDLATASQNAAAGLCPRHSMVELAEALDAEVHDGAGVEPSRLDRFAGSLTRSSPLWWAIARALRRRVRPGDVIYCTGEDIGMPVALLCGTLPGVKVAMMAHFVDRPKGKLALALFGARRRVALFCAVSLPQVRFLRQFLKLPDSRVMFVWDQTDTEFFKPGPQTPGKARPVIASVGLEQRDYGTLAEATADLDLDVRISGFSKDTKVIDRAFPNAMPANMSRRFYPWPELQQLYRDADIMVVSVFPNRYAAGVQAFMEALSSGRPVVVTATEGLEGYVDRPDAMRLVPPGDARAMREAITELLSRPDEAERLARTAADLARERHRCEQYVETIATALRRLAAEARR